MDYPDSCEAVALRLFEQIREAEPKDARGRNIPEAARLLGLYAECLQAVRGDRPFPGDLLN